MGLRRYPAWDVTWSAYLSTEMEVRTVWYKTKISIFGCHVAWLMWSRILGSNLRCLDNHQIVWKVWFRLSAPMSLYYQCPFIVASNDLYVQVEINVSVDFYKWQQCITPCEWSCFGVDICISKWRLHSIAGNTETNFPLFWFKWMSLFVIITRLF